MLLALAITSMLFSTLNVFAQSGIINTIAGNGTTGYTGAGGPATAAELNNPTGVAIDGSGNIYIADQPNNCIRMVNPYGIISTFAGTGVAGYSGDGGAATEAMLNSPREVAIDGSGNVYIADVFNQCIRKVNSSGIISTLAGTGVVAGYSGDGGAATAATFHWPQGVAVDCPSFKPKKSWFRLYPFQNHSISLPQAYAHGGKCITLLLLMQF